ncbi:MAG: valine--tRNA ligase [Bacteroidales bacterium]|nr:valine--tRNA ligase [Bacteroidales bacterium]
MEIQAKYDPKSIEHKWYSYWLENKIFHSEPDEREPYTIVIPPPNVTGVLHMGHMLNNTIQDVLVRRARMKGYNACWVPGTDHASIATEAKVVAKLKDEGIDKWDLTRDQFLEHAWEWKEKHGGIILEQLKKLGASCDWDRTKFTMDEDLSQSVIKVFIELYQKGNIYRGVKMINWDPSAKTAISDEEVLHKEVQSKLYYLKYKIEGTENDFVSIATTRPETILGDTAVCVNPNDTRFVHLKGKKVIVPLVNRVVPIIQDEYVDMEFGTGCLKITPAHDLNDYQIGIKHNLDNIDILNDDGTLSEKAELYIGKDRFEVRKEIVKDLEKSGSLEKVEDYINKVGFSERTNAVIEPKLSMQWFVNMKELAKPALEAVMSDDVKFHPAKYKNTYRHWMENVQDWNISRQLWWGHRIPAYYIQNSNDFVVAESKEEALAKAIEKTGNKNLVISDIHQEEDVLDTWFSSWLWPISVFDGINNPENEDFKYYYPTNDLITAPEIIFFWVARMIMAGYEYEGNLPFKNVYFTGIVRDGQGRKMSKSLGNSPDPLKLIDDYGADAVRIGMLFCSPAGNDLLFDIQKNPKTGLEGYPLPEQGRNFANKIWNAFRLVKSWNVDESLEQPEYAKKAIEWFDNKLNSTIVQMEQQYETFRLSEVLMSVYKLFWDDFSSWYLEWIKPAYQASIDLKTYEATLVYIEKLIQLLHPFMPFITEEIWFLLRDKNERESISLSEYPKVGEFDTEILQDFETSMNVISEVRRIRKEKNIASKDSLKLFVKPNQKFSERYINSVMKIANLELFEKSDEAIEGAVSFRVSVDEYFVPMDGMLNIEEEILKLKAELKYEEGFLISVDKKLSNDRFVNNAPKKVVDIERKKKADAKSKISAINEQLKRLEA